MSAEPLYYQPRTPRRLLPKTNTFQVDVNNDWDLLAEAAIASYPEPSPQLDHLVVLLESHGVLVHRVLAPNPQTQPLAPPVRSPFSTDPFGSPIHTSGATIGNFKDATGLNTQPVSLFPQNAALVYGTRVIQAQPTTSKASSQDVLHSDGGKPASGDAEHAKALFDSLERAGAEVVRWLPASSTSGTFKTTEGKLVDIQETTAIPDSEEEGPRLSPSDIVILSPTLLITRLSSCTNNKGLEYLWSVLSRPGKHISKYDEANGRTSGPKMIPPLGISNPSRPTTTLLVRITEPDASSTNSPAIAPVSAYSPRSPTFSTISTTHLGPKHGPALYTPLCRALVPIDAGIMLYDPALVAEGEARRLKSVLDRVQQVSKNPGEGESETSDLFAARSSKRDSGMSYGTFGSVDQSDDEGWQFISVDGLHLTSIFLVSPQLALLSMAPSASTFSSCSAQEALAKVSQVLDSLGVRAVSVPFTEVNELGGGVRDAVMVLRRESRGSISDDGQVEGVQQHAWDQRGEEEPTEGCFDGIVASIGTWFCGWLTSDTSSQVEVSV